jgi:hypothetical protein
LLSSNVQKSITESQNQRYTRRKLLMRIVSFPEGRRLTSSAGSLAAPITGGAGRLAAPVTGGAGWWRCRTLVAPVGSSAVHWWRRSAAPFIGGTGWSAAPVTGGAGLLAEAC